MPGQRPSTGRLGGHGPSRSDGMSVGPYRRRLLPVCCPTPATAHGALRRISSAGSAPPLNWPPSGDRSVGRDPASGAARQRRRRRRTPPNSNARRTTMISTHNHPDMGGPLGRRRSRSSDATAAHPSKQLPPRPGPVPPLRYPGVPHTYRLGRLDAVRRNSSWNVGRPTQPVGRSWRHD